jgi:predicted Rossmann fold flavoprotein
MKNYDVVILGGGASGLMCAGNVTKKISVAILDVNNKLAQKLKISGGGKCNITNASVSVENFDGDTQLLSYALNKFSKENLLRYLDRNSVPLELRKKRYYFCQNSADEIIDVLKHNAKYADIFLGHKVLSVKKEVDDFIVITQEGEFRAKKLVVATGGKSYEKIGASEIGLNIAKSFGIKVKEFTPALVGLTLQQEQFWMKELSGLSCYVHIKVEGKVLKEEMLFAHKGISGPAVLSASLYWKKGELSIDFLPEKNILELSNGSKKLLSSVMALPKRLAKAILKVIDVEDKECRYLSKEDRMKMQKIHNYTFAPAGNFGFTKAEVSRGGVVAEELQANSLMSKKVKNLFFIGEVVDVTGELGGYNFQWAFSSGVVCANALKAK